MTKRVGRRYNATERANARPIQPDMYRVDCEDRTMSDPNGTKRVSQIHSKVISDHTRGLVTFSGDQIVLAVDPAKLTGEAVAS